MRSSRFPKTIPIPNFELESLTVEGFWKRYHWIYIFFCMICVLRGLLWRLWPAKQFPGPEILTLGLGGLIKHPKIKDLHLHMLQILSIWERNALGERGCLKFVTIHYKKRFVGFCVRGGGNGSKTQFLRYVIKERSLFWYFKNTEIPKITDRYLWKH
jgi:hypothetical protein